MVLSSKALTAKEVREIARDWINKTLPEFVEILSLGLPEIDDRYDFWRVSIVIKTHRDKSVGEISVNSEKEIVSHTEINLIESRIKTQEIPAVKKTRDKKDIFRPSPIPNKIILGGAVEVLSEFPRDSAQLMITSPPYYNAKPEYSEYIDYQEYLDFLRRVFVRVHSVLSEGRFVIVNVSPVLVRRVNRSSSSHRIPIPFDIHKVLESVGFEYIDDIIWEKPEGAGWNIGRGRRFAADRQPLQYKPVIVTEYVLVYRKKTDKLIDWNIRQHYDQKAVAESRINGEYDVTNVWKITPSHRKEHPATFPDELVRKLIRYYSFKGDLVLDPFAGTGVVGKVAYELGRRFLLIDNDPRYYQLMKSEFQIIASNNRVDFDTHESSKVNNNDN
ncbi:MAG: site-specific DNA-methyltransferase [Candidatus Bathyarchaeota archaeon]|nr:site-specific DNA-methyltransferase [Candidatus Bathyarchaeota archaeon]